MADIFISYSKPDREKVVLLAAYLESEGWTVWWDNNLAAGDAFRDEIVRELAAARAVIVIWTQTSTKSDFVRAEAGRAKADGKLIPVKEPGLGYRDIPLPFGEMHTESLPNHSLIRAAVVAQLAKPNVQPTTLRVATKTLRYQMLTWMGIIGGSVTLFTNLQGFLNLADWARWLTTHWHEWMVVFWQWCFSFLRVKIPPNWASLLSFVLFGTMIAVSQRLLAAKAAQKSKLGTPDVPAVALSSARGVIAAAYILVTAIGILIVNLSLEYWPWPGVKLLMVLWIFSPLIVLIGVSNHRLKVALTAMLVTLFFFIIQLATIIRPEGENSPIFGFLAVLLYPGITAAMLMLAPVNSLLKRLVFLTLGLALLLALNVLSYYAPDLREWLKPPIS